MADDEHDRIDVAIAVIFRDDRVLICQRREGTVLAGYWEFPGGKCFPGEAPGQCLIRELEEELAIEVRITRPLPLIEHDYPHARVRLHPFLCEHVSGEPRPLASERITWVRAADLKDYRLPSANVDLVRALIGLHPPAR